MGWTRVCKFRNMSEGEWADFTVDGEAIMLVWPDGAGLKAFQGLCPHENAALKTGIFNGSLITCTAHGWVFDARSGKGLSPPGWMLEEYPLRVEDGWVEVDLDLVLEYDEPQGPP